MIYIWVIVYGLINILSEWVATTYEIGWVVAAGMLAYDGMLVAWITDRGKRNAVGLCRPAFGADSDLLCVLALVLFPIYNLAGRNLQNLTVPFAIEMFCAALTEEICFRGFLQPVLSFRGKCTGILLTSLVFSLLHSVNFYTEPNWYYVLLQMLGAFATGISYGAVRLRWESILPCVAAHFLTNITAADNWTVIGLFACTALQLVIGLWLCAGIRERR